MSKLKVSVANFIRALRPAPNGLRRYLFVVAFFKTLRDHAPFCVRQPEDRVSRYWSHRSTVEVLAAADRLHEEDRHLEVYELLNRIRYGKEVEVLWRIARALYNLAFEDVTGEVRWEMMEEAKNVLAMALPAET
ncbi:hypothetical protein NQ318_002806 [Aromia moschata]|uniref:Uncharacterized protein n=1 Tax=Aromia moschata TaxID=1265417 RepID=A0AAV8XT50_9CUCU|nr:hypothetical protein NQ318_002806 [Aromia moschata]